jgi:hypothetical protein
MFILLCVLSLCGMMTGQGIGRHGDMSAEFHQGAFFSELDLT